MVAQQKEDIFDVLSSLESNTLSRKQLSPNELHYLVDVAKDLNVGETLRIKAARTLTHASRNLQNLNNFAGDLLALVRENSRVSPFAVDLLRSVISRSNSRGFVVGLLRSLKSTGLNTSYLLSLNDQLRRKLVELESNTGRYDSPQKSVDPERAAEKAVDAFKKGAERSFGYMKGRSEGKARSPHSLTVKKRFI